MGKSKNGSRPVLTIDLKKSRLRVFKETLHMIDDPSYIQLLINPNARKIIIIGSTSYDPLAHKTYNHINNSSQSFELYSRSLITEIKRINPELLDGHTFNIVGRLQQRNTLAVFDICNKRAIVEVEER